MPTSREVEAAQIEISELLEGEEFNTKSGRDYLLELLDNYKDPVFFKKIVSLPKFNKLEKLYNFLNHANEKIQLDTINAISLAYLSKSEAGRLMVAHYHRARANTHKKEMLLTNLAQLHAYELSVIFSLLPLAGITTIILEKGNWATRAKIAFLAELIDGSLITKIKLRNPSNDMKDNQECSEIYQLLNSVGDIIYELDLIEAGLLIFEEWRVLCLTIQGSPSLFSLAISLADINDEHLEKLGSSLTKSKVEILSINKISHLSSAQLDKFLNFVKESKINRLEIPANEIHQLEKGSYNLCQSLTTKSGEKLVHFIDDKKASDHTPTTSASTTQESNASAIYNIIKKVNFYMKKRSKETYSFAILTWLFGYSGKDYYERRASWKFILGQLAKIETGNNQSLKSAINIIDDLIKKFGERGRSKYANKLQKLKEKLLKSSDIIKNKPLKNYISTSYKIYDALDLISQDTRTLSEDKYALTNLLQNPTYLERIQLYSQYQSSLSEFLSVKEVNETEVNNTLRY